MQLLPAYSPFLNPIEEIFSAWRWKFYDHHPYEQMPLLDAMTATAEVQRNVRVEYGMQEDFFPHCSINSRYFLYCNSLLLLLFLQYLQYLSFQQQVEKVMESIKLNQSKMSTTQHLATYLASGGHLLKLLMQDVVASNQHVLFIYKYLYFKKSYQSYQLVCHEILFLKFGIEFILS